jgi:hypothetical protein
LSIEIARAFRLNISISFLVLANNVWLASHYYRLP